MARPKSADEALEAIEQEARWRRRELDLLYQNLLGAKEEARNSLIRSYVLALYAHWEGLIKRCSEVYLSYLSELLARRNISVSQLVVPLQSTVLLRLYVTASGKDGAKKSFLDSCTRFLNDPDGHRNIELSALISAGNNLNSTVLAEILSILNINTSYYTLKKVIIDERLIDWRNSIAHGGRDKIEFSDLQDLNSQMLEISRRFETDLSNTVATRAYREG